MANRKELLQDFRLRVGGGNTKGEVQRVLKEKPRTRPHTLKYKKNSWGRTTEGWQEPVYDLGEISRAGDIESNLSVSFRRHRELLLKEGFYWEGKNPKVLSRIKRRIREIELNSDIPFEEILRDLASNLIKFHSAFLYLRRDQKRSTGGKTRRYGKTRDPIAAIEVIDPITMSCKQNKSGNIVRWRQQIQGEGSPVFFEPDEVICITMDKKTGFVFGTPYCVPVLDDILALRRLEELVEVVATKFCFPLLHYRVGTEDHPAEEYQDESGNYFSEVDQVRDSLGDLPTEGSIITPERHEITVIGAEGKTLDLKPYLEHFERRVLGGLRLSEIDLGRGDTPKSTAGALTQNMADAVKDYQSVLSLAVNFHLLQGLIWEEGFELTDENLVLLRFPPVNQEEQRAKENHEMGLFHGNVISRTQARTSSGWDPLAKTEEKDMYLETVELPLAKAKHAENKSTEGGVGATKSKTRPANQHGKAATKKRIPKNDALTTIWEAGRRRVQNGEDLDVVLKEALSLAASILKPDCLVEMENCSEDEREIFFKKIVRKELRKIGTRTKVMVCKLGDSIPLVNILDAQEILFLGLQDRLLDLAEVYAAQPTQRNAKG